MTIEISNQTVTLVMLNVSESPDQCSWYMTARSKSTLICNTYYPRTKLLFLLVNLKKGGINKEKLTFMWRKNSPFSHQKRKRKKEKE